MIIAAPHDILSDFATSPAGWIAGLLVPVLLALFLRKAARDTKFRDRVDQRFEQLASTQARLSEDLHVAVTRLSASDDAAKAALMRVPELERQVAVLEAKYDALSARVPAGGAS